MFEKVPNILINLASSPVGPEGPNAKVNNDLFSDLGNYVYLIGTLFVLLALVAATFYPKAKAKMEDYKKRQLEVYNKNRVGKRLEKNYKNTKLYLPF